MTIEIRPAAVRAQLAQKAALLSAIGNAASDAYGKVGWFCGTGGVLAGEGYEAARVHMGQYKNFCLKVHECVEMTREADLKVAGALGRFGAASVVSESEWLEKKRFAEQQAARCRSEASRLEAQPAFPGSSLAAMSARLSASIWDTQAEYAARMLSDIYSYCAETDGLYGGDLGKLADAVRAGASAFASCGFDASTGKWGEIDYSWTSDEIEAIAARNLDKLLFKGYGEVDRALILDPVADSVGKWWEGNGTTVKNVGKVVFGIAGVVGSVALMASGVGAPAGIAAMLGIVGGSMDVGSGLAGLAEGKEVDWGKEVGRGVASALGGDPEKVEFAIEAVTTVSSVCSISKLPSSAGKLIDSAKGLDGLGKVAKATDSLKEGFEAADATADVIRSAPLFEGKAAAVNLLVKDACDFVDDVGGAVDIAEKGLDALSEYRKARRSGYAGNEFAAVGNGD